MQRQIKACTHCRQHKVKCDAARSYPKPCSRCSKFSLGCIVDQNFKPRKGGQVELLREHLAKMQQQIQSITGSRHVDLIDNIDDSIAPPNVGFHEQKRINEEVKAEIKANLPAGGESDKSKVSSAKYTSTNGVSQPEMASHLAHTPADDAPEHFSSTKEIESSVAERMAAGGRLVPIPGPYILEDITLDESQADVLHNYFMDVCSPYMPIFESGSAGELYARSEFLFWAVMTTAALAEPTATLYLSLVGPVKRLAATKCLLATTRSSSVVQALLVLCTWPLPSEKMLEDMSPRYVSLAYSMGLQLGIHRGKFIYEFSRNQQLMPNAVKWRSLTWIQTYITQQMISASTGIPASMPVDYIIDNALHDKENHLTPRILVLLKIAVFYSKLVAIMGSSITTQDGLMEPNSRCATLDLLKTDLLTLFAPQKSYDDPVIEISILHARCILDSFAFLPETPMSHQSGFIIDAFQACTRIVTLARKLVGNRKIIEFPLFIRNPCSLAALILFRLQLMPGLPDQYIASARESVVTIHHMYRNVPPSWLDSKVNNDVSRIAKILESLNHVMITRPELLRSRRVMRHMRSHLTFSLFYELIYIIHEARRRNANKMELTSKNNKLKKSIDQVPKNGKDGADDQHRNDSGIQDVLSSKRKLSEVDESSPDSWVNSEDSPVNGVVHQLIQSAASKRHREINPLPLFKNISKDSYVSSTVVSPNGTTSTKLFKANSASGVNESEPNAIPQACNINGSPNIPVPVSNDEHISHFNISHPSKVSDGNWTYTTNGSVELSQQIPTTHVSPQNSVYLQNSSNPSISNNPVTMDTINSNSDLTELLDGIDWMNTEGDDFLGWMLPRNE